MDMVLSGNWWVMVGKNMHEDPQVPNYGKRGSGKKLKEGLVLAIEPMINLGRKEVYTESDGWTVRTKDGKPSVHFEHDVCIRKNKADILSNYSTIEKEEEANPNFIYTESNRSTPRLRGLVLLRCQQKN